MSVFIRTLVLAWLAIASLGVAAQERGLPPCDDAVRFKAEYFQDPEVDLNKSARNLASLGAPAPKGFTALGLVTVENAISVASATSCRGLIVQLKFLHPVLRVAHELPPDTCAHGHVLHHEYTHVRIYREMARQFRELHYPWPDDPRPDRVLSFAKSEYAHLQEAQRLFDSPEEYAGNSVACKGEIPRLLAAAKG